MADHRTLASGKLDYRVLAGILSAAAIASLWFFHARNEILLSGDAVAHINIARRVFDSRTPGPMQLGTVWLPLPHLLTIPFVIGRWMWQSGIGGSIVSMISYVIAGLGLFRLLSMWSRLAAWIGTLVFAANPNLLYVQTTALNEPLYLVCFLWSVVFFAEARRAFPQNEITAGKWLEKGAIALAAGILTRYDGWFLACIWWLAILPAAVRSMRRVPLQDSRALRKSIFNVLLLTALAPTLWLAYNFGSKGNALDFANGPYSPKAIAQRTVEKGAPPYPGEHHPWMAGVYFTKAAQLNMGEGIAAKVIVLLAAVAGVLLAMRRGWQIMLLLWSPLLFYALSIAYGSVPIFIPVWWPFSYYNVRYGLELLPAIAAGVGLCSLFIERIGHSRRMRVTGLALIIVITALAYINAWRSVPICLREVQANGHARFELDRRLAAVLATLPKNAIILAYTGAHSGAFEMAGVPFRRTINEGFFRVWDASLLDPAKAAEYVVASDDDPVAAAVAAHPKGLNAIAQITVEGQTRVVVYKSVTP